MHDTTDHLLLFRKFDELINNPSTSDQRLLQEISQLKRSAVLSQRVKEDVEQTFGPQRVQQYYHEVEEYIDWIVDEGLDRQGLLVRTQKKLFRQIIGLRLQISSFSKQTKKQRQKREELSSLLKDMKRYPDKIFNPALKEKSNLIFKEEDIDKVREDIKEVEVKIESIQLLDENIDSKIDIIRKTTQQLRKQKEDLEQKLTKRHLILGERAQLLLEIEKQDKQLKQKQKSQEEQVLGKELLQILLERLELQDQMQQEEAERNEFMELLVNFRQKYVEVQKRNTKMKKQLFQNKARKAISEDGRDDY